MKKVKYKSGDNLNFEYFIVATKEKITLEENSLAFSFDRGNNESEIVKIDGIIGNYDFILAEMDKQEKFIRHIPCTKDEIEE